MKLHNPTILLLSITSVVGCATNPIPSTEEISRAASEIKTRLTTQLTAPSPDTLLAAKRTQLPTLYAELPRYESEDDLQQIIANYNDAQTYTSHLADHAEDSEEKAVLSQYAEDLDYAIKPLREKNGDSMFSLLGGPAYTPEQGALLAGGGLYSFTTDRNDIDLQRSSITGFMMVNFPSNGSMGYGFQSKQNIFFNQNNSKYEGVVNFGQQSSQYFGVGYDKGSTVEMGENTTYDANRGEYIGSLAYRFFGDWYFGANAEINYVKVTEQSDYILADQDFQDYADKPFTLGLGLVLEYDSRDFAVNAKEGLYFKANYLNFNEKIGSDSDYYKANFEFRSYYSFNPTNTIASFTQFQATKGDIPFYDLATLGGANSMRGIFKGQFIDKTAFETTVEWRHTFSRANGLPSNHGMTLWSGIGGVGESVNTLSDDLFVSYGVGYRYQIQPKMNIRLDLGMSEFGNGFYFNFTEAF